MNLIPTEKLPCRKANSEYKNLRTYLLDFMHMNVPYAKVEYAPEEYANTLSARNAFARMIRICDFPVQTIIINSELYLIRLNWEG